MDNDYADMMQEIFDLREETMRLRSQIKSDDQYLEHLIQALDDEHWERRIQCRRVDTQSDHPEVFR